MFAEFMQNLQEKKGYVCNIIRSPSKNRTFAHTYILQRYCNLQVLF